MKNKKQTIIINHACDLLQSYYDCISKIDAIKFLKGLDDSVKISLKAFELYEEKKGF